MNVGISSPPPATEDDNHDHLHHHSGEIKPTCVTTTSPSNRTAAAVNCTTTSDHPSSHNIASHGSGSSSHSVVAHAASFARSSSQLESDPNNNIHNSKGTNRQDDHSNQNDCSSNSSDCTPNSKSNRHSTTSNSNSHNNDDSSGSDPCSSLTRSASFPTISKNEGSHSSAEGHCFSSISTTRTTSPGTRSSSNNNSQDRVVSDSDPTSPLPLSSSSSPSSPQQQSPKSHDKGEEPTSESSNAVRSIANDDDDDDDDDSKRPQSIVSAPAKTTGSFVKHHIQEQLPLVATTKRNHKTSATKTTSTSQTCAGEAATAVIATAAATSTTSKSAPNSVRTRYLASSKTLFLSSRDRLFARKSASTLAGGAGSKQGSNDKHNKNNNATGGASVSGSSIGTTSTGTLSTKPPLPLHHTHSCTSTLSTKSFYQLVGSNSAWSGRKPGPGRANNNTTDKEYSKVSRTSSSSSSFFDRFGWYGAVTGIGGFWLACVTFVGLFTLITVVVAQVTAAASNPSSSSFALSSSSSTSISFTSYSSLSLPFRFYMSSSGENNKDAGAAPPLKVVVATRLHNRQSTHALTDDAVRHKIRDFAHVCEMADAIEGVIAVDAEDPQLLHQVQQEIESSSTPMHLLPITPWGRFVPALNALIGYAAGQEQNMADCILFVSAETSATRESIQMLLHHMMDHSHDDETESARLRSSKLSSTARTPKLDNSTLVVGARLTGHDYRSSRADQRQEEEQEEQQQPDGNTVADNAQVGATTPRVVELNGRTTPWNTLAVWNLRKLATTGFLLLSEGYLTSSDKEPSYGVEEVVTIALLQQLLGKENAVAKLVPVPGVDWDANFGADVDRQQWHESKMESKLTRAARQMELTKLSGVVHHY
ncbi:hypothetical protein ACA910_017956 [Epithemia clementina (nom. ined.)]